MQPSNSRPWAAAIAAALTLAQLGIAADHGPVFGLAMPTNPQGGWSFDLGVNDRSGTASTLEAELSYGLTLKYKARRFRPRCFSTRPISELVCNSQYTHQRRFQRLAWWRFQRLSV